MKLIVACACVICGLVFSVEWLSLLAAFCLPLLVTTLSCVDDVALPAETKG